ncbi:MAG: hypothetical protein AB7O24_02675 [Kofleriaceae bacterium]
MSSDFQPSRELLDMLETKLDSLEKLELVLALRDAPNVTSSVNELAATLKFAPEILRQVADEISSALVVSENDVVRLVIHRDDPVLVEAARLHGESRHQMLGLLSTIAIDRIRRMAARAFADAFHIRGKKDGDHG